MHRYFQDCTSLLRDCTPTSLSFSCITTCSTFRISQSHGPRTGRPIGALLTVDDDRRLAAAEEPAEALAEGVVEAAVQHRVPQGVAVGQEVGEELDVREPLRNLAVRSDSTQLIFG